MPQLIVSIEDDFPQVIEISGPKFTIGRHSGNNLQLPFSFISSFHAEMVRDGSGHYRLTDLDSHNGTFINGNPVNDTTLKDGDQVAFGPVRARFLAPAAAAGGIPEARPAYIADSAEASAAAAAPMAISQSRLEAKLREKIAAEFERENVAIAEALRAAKTEYERICRESEIQKSDMAMRQHIVRDLEKSRVREEEKLQAVRARTEDLETARQELARIEANLAESREAGEKAEAALKIVREHESRSSQIAGEVAARQKEADELGSTLAARRRELASSAEELEVLRREIEEVGRGKLHDLHAEVDRLRQQTAELEKGIALRTEQAATLDSARRETEKRAADFAARSSELSTELANREKRLSELEAGASRREQEIEAGLKKLSALRTETAQLESTRLPELVQLVDGLKKQSEVLQRDLDGRLNRFQEIDAQREEAENKTVEARAQLAGMSKEIEGCRRDREQQIKELQEARATIEVLKKEIEKHASENETLLQKRRGLEEEVVNSGQLRDELEARIKESRMAASQCEAEVKRLEEVQARQKELESDCRARKEELAATVKDLDARRRELGEVEAALKDGRGKVDEIMTVRLVKLRAEADGLENERAGKRREIEALVADLDKESAVRRKALTDLETELEKARQGREEQKNSLAEKTAELKHVDSECRKRTAELEKLSAENNVLQKESDSIRKEIETARLQLEEARKQTEDHRKVGKKVAAELRSLEEHKSSNARLEEQLAARKSELHELDESIAQQRKVLRQLEKTLGSIQRTARKEKRRIVIPIVGRELRHASREADEPPPPAQPPEPAQVQATSPESDELARRNEELARRLAEKESALSTLEKELHDLVSSAAYPPQAAAPADAVPEATVAPLDSRQPPDGVELLNTGEEEIAAAPAASPAQPAKPEEPSKGRPGFRVSRAARFLRGDVPAAAAAVIAGGRRLGAAATRGRKPATTDGRRLRIVHPRSREETRFFTEGPGAPGGQGHPPIGLVALAACTRGSVHQSLASIPEGDDPVLLLLSGSLEKDGDLVRSAASATRNGPLLACWREGRLEKLAAGLEGGADFRQFADMLGSVDGILSTDEPTTALLRELPVANRTIEVPLPCPVDVPGWDFSIPLTERRDAIFVSADGYDPEREDHRTRLELVNLIAAKHRLRVTVCHHLPRILAHLNIPEDLLEEAGDFPSYAAYLSAMARHRFALGFAKNAHGGEVMGDALLTGTVYIGGRTGIEPILFTGSSLVDDELEDLQEKISTLISQPDAYAKSLQAAKKRALARVSFGAVRTSLEEFLESVSKEPVAVG